MNTVRRSPPDARAERRYRTAGDAKADMGGRPHQMMIHASTAILPDLSELADAQAESGLHVHIARKDYEHLTQLVDAWPGPDSPARRLVAAKLARGIICNPEDLPRDLVMMNTRITYRRDPQGDVRSCVLLYPDCATPPAGSVSITTNFGALLLGLMVGHTIRQQGPYGLAFFLQIDGVDQSPSSGT